MDLDRPGIIGLRPKALLLRSQRPYSGTRRFVPSDRDDYKGPCNVEAIQYRDTKAMIAVW